MKAVHVFLLSTLMLVVVTRSRASDRPSGGDDPASVWTSAPAAALGYVAEALAGNLSLQARSLELDAARARLASARAALQPRLDLVARYTRADGGRAIEFPTGDLLNGVYATLNESLRAQGRPASFPQLSNTSIPLLRPEEQETKLRLTQPLYRPEITRGVRARREATVSELASLDAFRRELRLTVLTAYYAWLQADAAVGILDSALGVTTEALRVTRALQENDQATEDRVLRAESDDLAVRQQRAEAVRDRNSAEAFFNVLLHRPLDTPLVRTTEDELRAVARPLLDAPSPVPGPPSRREELRALDAAIAAATAAESASTARSGPTLDLAVEGGNSGRNLPRALRLQLCAGISCGPAQSLGWTRASERDPAGSSGPAPARAAAGGHPAAACLADPAGDRRRRRRHPRAAGPPNGVGWQPSAPST
jgi:outer membrane protein